MSSDLATSEATYTANVTTEMQDAEDDLAVINETESEIYDDQQKEASAESQAAADEKWMDAYNKSGGEGYDAQDYEDKSDDLAKQNAIIKSCSEDITAQENDPDFIAAEDDLSSIEGLGTGFSEIFEEIAELNESANSIGLSGSKMALDEFKSYMGQILQAAQDHLEANYNATMMECPGLTLSEAESYSSLSCQATNSENGVLMGLINEMSEDMVSWNQIYDDAKVEKNDDSNPLDVMFGGSEAQAAAQKMMDFARQMQALIIQTMTSLASQIGNSSSAMLIQMLFTFSEMVKEVQAIIDDTSLSNAEKANEIMPILMLMLSFFDAFKTEVEAEKTQNDNIMANATIDSSQMRIQDANAAVQIQIEQARAAYVMKIFSTVLIVTMALAMCLTANFALAVIVLAFASYDLTTTWDEKAYNMSDAFGGGLKGELIWSAIEAVCTMGIGMTGEFAAKTAATTTAKAAADAALVAAKEEIQIAARSSAKLAAEVAKTAGKELTQEQIVTLTENAEKVITERLRFALKSAVDGASNLYKKQTIGALISDLSRTQFKESMEALTKRVVDETLSLSETAGSAGYRFGDKLIETEAKNIAVQALVNILHVTEDQAVVAVDTSWSRFAKQVAFHGGLNFMMAAAVNNVIVDSTLAMFTSMRKNKWITDKQYEESVQGMKIAMQVIQALLLMVSGGVKGMTDSVSLNGSSTSWMRLANLLQQGSMGASAASEYVGARDTIDQGNAIADVQINMTLQDMIFESLKHLQEITKEDRDALNKQITEDTQGTDELEQTVFDGIEEGIQVLQASVV